MLVRGRATLSWIGALGKRTPRKNSSKPAGEIISRMRAGWSPALQNACHWLRVWK